MSSIKIIRNKIDSVINTKKITKTMAMVAIAKMRKAKENILLSHPYAKIITKLMSRILKKYIKYKHIFLHPRKKIKNIGIIIVSTNRGLCGSLNTNLFKLVTSIIQKYTNKKIKCHLYIIGKKGLLFFKNIQLCCIYKMIDLQDNISDTYLIKSVKNLLKQYQMNNIDKLFICYNQFQSSILQKPSILQLLPIEIERTNNKEYITQHWDYLYEPNADVILDVLFKKYIFFQVFQSILENTLSEQAARMVSMQTASDNSKNIIEDLQLIYNKMRQFSITQELTEIVSGASVVSKNE